MGLMSLVFLKPRPGSVGQPVCSLRGEIQGKKAHEMFPVEIILILILVHKMLVNAAIVFVLVTLLMLPCAFALTCSISSIKC